MERVPVAGGWGFIGSHIVDISIHNHKVVFLDDLSTGLTDNAGAYHESDRLMFMKESIISDDNVSEAPEGVSLVHHFAAQSDVHLANVQPLMDFRINMKGSMKLLKSMKRNGAEKIIFASSGGTVYGDQETFPTPEECALHPISVYGAAKVSFECNL